MRCVWYSVFFFLAFISTCDGNLETIDVTQDNTLYWEPYYVHLSKFKFASYYNDDMVLQQAPKRSLIWGYDDRAGGLVTLSITGKKTLRTYSTKALAGPAIGRFTWKILLDSFKGNDVEYIITAKNSKGIVVKISNVLFGDVWLCSGQSNMEMTVPMIFNGSAEVEEGNMYPNIRLFTPNLVQTNTTLYDFESIMQPWSRASNVSLGGTTWSFFSAVCWLYGRELYKRLKYPIGLIASDWGGTPVEAWSSEDALKRCKTDGKQHIYGPQYRSVLWNGMIHPLINMTIYGVIWYQGEQNAMNGPASISNYFCTFTAMIHDWRVKFLIGTRAQTDPLFPFGFVQLAPWREGRNYTYGFPDIRWHQTADYGYVPNHHMKKVFMAVTMDLPDKTSPYTSIHPRNKEDVVHRLIMAGMVVAYGQRSSVPFQGPFPILYKYRRTYNTLHLIYDQQLENRALDGFEVCCSGGEKAACSINSTNWVAVPIMKMSSINWLVLDTSHCLSSTIVMALRYAWLETPCQFKKCAIYGKRNKLPAPPFYYAIKKIKTDMFQKFAI